MDQTRARLVSTASTMLVAVAAAMWATDAYFRPGLTKQLSAGQIVLVEDLLISICLVPIILINAGSLRRLTAGRWLALAAIAVGPQAVATVLFTKAIGYAFGPTGLQFDVLHEVYLLYLLQPVFGLAFARIFLGERRRLAFWPFATSALIGVYLIVFADNPPAPWQIHHPQPVARHQLLGPLATYSAGPVLGRDPLPDVHFPVPPRI